MPCRDDSCDLAHCTECRGHTAGNVLLGGVCYDCWMLWQEHPSGEAYEAYLGRHLTADMYRNHPN